MTAVSLCVMFKTLFIYNSPRNRKVQRDEKKLLAAAVLLAACVHAVQVDLSQYEWTAYDNGHLNSNPVINLSASASSGSALYSMKVSDQTGSFETINGFTVESITNGIRLLSGNSEIGRVNGLDNGSNVTLLLSCENS